MPDRIDANKAASVVVREASGRVVGPTQVHGAGGVVRANERQWFEDAIRRATEGKPFAGIYEPKPGHVRAYVEAAAGPLNETQIDLRDAVLLSWSGS